MVVWGIKIENICIRLFSPNYVMISQTRRRYAIYAVLSIAHGIEKSESIKSNHNVLLEKTLWWICGHVIRYKVPYFLV